jgi:dUTP pyrophosphatase
MIELQYVGAALGMAGMAAIALLPPTQLVWGLGITAASCMAMGTYGFVTGQYGIAAAQAVYLLLNLLGLVRLYLERKEPIMNLVFVKKMVDSAKLPTKSTLGSTGYDIFASESVRLEEYGGRGVVSTGLQLDLKHLQEGIDLQVRPRSGLAAKYGITVLNSPGTIDRDYQGELKVILINHGDEPYMVNVGDRIAQLVVGVHAPQISWFPVAEVEVTTERGDGGFGSTGK